MALESSLLALAGGLSALADQRRAQWCDATGLDFETQYLRPLCEVVEEFQRHAADFVEAVDAALAELDV